MKQTEKQKKNLITLAETVKDRKEPLGIGLKNMCWAGVAIDLANKNNFKTTNFYGISFSELKSCIMSNNLQPQESRNSFMYKKTLDLIK